MVKMEIRGSKLEGNTIEQIIYENIRISALNNPV